jgi:hypothetical protein
LLSAVIGVLPLAASAQPVKLTVGYQPYDTVDAPVKVPGVTSASGLQNGMGDECQYQQQGDADAEAPTDQLLLDGKQRLVFHLPDFFADLGLFHLSRSRRCQPPANGGLTPP